MLRHLSLPASNAYTERVFSIMQGVWSKNRSRLSVSIVESELQVRLNFNLPCSEFTSFVEGNKTLILAAKSNAKYRWKSQIQIKFDNIMTRVFFIQIFVTIIFLQGAK